MLELTNLWWWLPLFSVLGAAAGILVSWKFPGSALRARVHRWRGRSAFFIGLVMAALAVAAVNRLTGAEWPQLGAIAKTVAAPIAAMIAAYIWSRRPDGPPQFITKVFDWLGETEKTPSPQKSPDADVERMVFRADWNARPSFEHKEEGLFVGRNELLGRLSSHFISKGGGTILISGVRGVGKTALVDRALVEARRKLADRYWEDLAAYLKRRAQIWHPIDMLVGRNVMTLGEDSGTGTETQRSTAQAGKQARRGAEEYLRRPGKTFLRHFNLVRKRIDKMWQASNSQLFVLKFSASDIAGALAEPDQKSTGKLRVDPEKLLRSIIRKLHATCHPSGPGEPAQILQWSLCPKKLRRAFFDDLQKAFDKSISKSYREIISNSINDFVKQQWTIESQSNLNPVRMIVAAVVFLVVFVGVYKLLPEMTFATAGAEVWKRLTSGTISTIAGILASYLTWNITAKWSRTSGSDSQRQAQFSFENDYSLARMQSDLESLMRSLTPPVINGFNPYRCFTRSTIVFDELDKLDNAEKQLDDVITHFKNFFTLSNSVFVFLTDHQFYEYLIRETTRAQLARHYSPQHTFFNEKIYLRKPEFSRFREAFYRFTTHDWILKQAASAESDPALIGYLLKPDRDPTTNRPALLNGDGTTVINSLQLSALTHFYIHRNEYAPPLRAAIEARFDSLGGHRNPLALAEIWASQARGDAGKDERDKTEADFRRADGWTTHEAVALLYYCRADFTADEQQAISRAYDALGKPPLTNFESVKRVPFSLGDLAQALCFQTRNHYFDLYQFVYDYVGDYYDGAPVISLEDKNFAQETRLSSRYQQLIEIAFDSVKEDHPSREYFNSLLMESLYTVFDKRGNGQGVKVGDVLFQAHRTEPSVKPGLSKAKAVTPDITAFNARDVQKINQAIIRVLRLALAHHAISSSTPNFETVLKSGDWNKVSDLRFEWNDDVQSIVKVTDKEPYEHELIRFWNENKPELEALDAELVGLWKDLAMPADAIKMRSAIRELRSKTESVRLGSIKISETDAEMLKKNVKTPESRSTLIRTTILERIRVEEDAHILAETATLIPSDPTVTAQLEARKRDFETATHRPLQAVLSPIDTDCFVFLTSAPPPDGPLNWPDFPRENDFVLWYVPAHKEITDSERVWFYFPPSEPNTPTLVDDYVLLATQARLRRIGIHLQASEYKDATLARRAGAETMGHIGTGSEFQRTLSRPAIEVAISLLDKAKKDFIEQQASVWQTYQIEPPVSGQDATSKLAAYVVKLSTNEKEPLTFNLTTAVEDAIKQSLRADIADANAETWLKVFASGSSRPGQFDKWMLEDVIEQLFDERLTELSNKGFDTALHQDEEMRKVVRHELVAWLSQTIVDLANTKGIELKKMLSVPEWAGDLEIRRRSFRSPPLPAQPAQPITFQTRGLGRLRRRRQTTNPR